MKVVNRGGERVRQFFFGHGEIVIEPEVPTEIPDEVWRVWNNPEMWGGGECRLEIYRPPEGEERPRGGGGGKK